MKGIPFLILLCASACFSLLKAQDVTIKNVSVAQGLSQSTVNDMLQDKYGYVWISTGDGLDRFDGHNFLHFRYDPGSSNSLPSNTVRGLWEDTLRSCIWIGTDNGICFYDQRNGHMHAPFINKTDFKNAYCVPLKTDDQFLWCSIGNKGIAKIEISTQEILWLDRFVLQDMLFTLPNAREVFYRKNSNYLFRMDLLSGRKDSIAWIGNGKISIAANFKILSANVYELYSSEGVFSVDFGHDTITSVTLPVQFVPGEVVVDVCTDAKGYRFAAVAGCGVCVLNPEGYLHRKFEGTYEYALNGFFDFRNVRHFMLDKHQVMWCATDGSGVIMIDLKAEKFTPLQGINPQGTVEVVHSFTRGMAEIDGQLWVGTYREGIYIYDKKSKGMEHILMDETTVRGISDMEDCGSFVLLGCESGLFKINKPYQSSQLNLIDGSLEVKDILLSNGVCKLATNKGVYEYSISTDQLRQNAVVQGRNTTFLFEDTRGFLFIGLSNEGIVKVLADGSLKHMDKVAGNMPNLQMLSMVNFGDGYYAASNHGLFELGEDLQIKAHYNEQDGLANAFVYGILIDKNGMLWLSTNNGVSMFNPESKKVRNFNMADGLQSLEHNRSSFLKDSDGCLYFGGTTGISQLARESLEMQIEHPIVRLSGLRINNQKIFNVDSLVFAAEGLSFGYYQSNYEFEIAVLEFFRPERYDVEYMLEGWDSEFQKCGGDFTIRYTNLPPGAYTLVCRIANDSNAPIHRVFSFSIETPYWRKWWFIALLFLLGSAILLFINVSIIRSRSHRATAALERVREIERMRSRISKDIHDEVGAGLTKITLMSEAAKINLEDNADYSSTLDKLSETSRTITRGLHEIIWSVNPDADNSASLFDHINQYAHEFLEDTEIVLNAQVLETTQLALSPAVRRNIFLILKEALNNIVKHAYASQIQLSLHTTEERTFLIVITDNGQGFSNDAHQFRGRYGLQNMRARASDSGLDLQISSEVGKGTIIRITGCEGERIKLRVE